MTEREFAISVVEKLHGAGFEALWAGGCVRDELLGLVPKDYDIATSAVPDEVQRLFRRTLAIGASFGVVEVLGPRQAGEPLRVQVATFRTDGGYSDGRRPDQVVFASAREDALRRDFTINGMFFDPLQNVLHDFVGGQRDLHARILRAIGDPHVRFQEDKLRLLRAVRIATRFDLTIEPATAAAITAMANQLPVVSAERIAEELRQLLVHPRRVRGLNLLMDLGLAQSIMPELLPMKGWLDPGVGNLWEHVLRVLDLLGPTPSFPLALAALLHHVGNPVGRTEMSVRLTADIARRWKLSNAERERACWLVENHRYLADARAMRPSKLKTIFRNPGVHELLALHRADALALDQSIDHVEYCEQLLRTWTPADLNPPPLVTGEDVRALGMVPGPRFKELLDAVREAQLDGTIATRKEALALLRQLASAIS